MVVGDGWCSRVKNRIGLSCVYKLYVNLGVDDIMQESHVSAVAMEHPVQASRIQNEIAEYREQNNVGEMSTLKSSKKNKMLSKATSVVVPEIMHKPENHTADQPLSSLDGTATSKKKSHPKNQKKNASVNSRVPIPVVSESAACKLTFKKNKRSVHPDVWQIVNSELQEMRQMIVDLRTEVRTGSPPATALGKQPVT